MWKHLYLLIVAVLFLGMFSQMTLADTLVVGQKNKSFVKDGKKVEKLNIKVGDTIRFMNQDPFFHNVFSLSDLKTFDLGSFPKGQFKPVTFDKPGTVEVECAIHPQMYLEVTVK
jgi:plastocyanin